jgi:hypothetical protein
MLRLISPLTGGYSYQDEGQIVDFSSYQSEEGYRFDDVEEGGLRGDWAAKRSTEKNRGKPFYKH